MSRWQRRSYFQQIRVLTLLATRRIRYPFLATAIELGTTTMQTKMALILIVAAMALGACRREAEAPAAPLKLGGPAATGQIAQ